MSSASKGRAYSPVAVRATFYDPVPEKPADEKNAAVFRPLSDVEGLQDVFNVLITGVEARMLSPPELQPDPSDSNTRKLMSFWQADIDFADAEGATLDQLTYILGEGVPLDIRFGYEVDDVSLDVVIAGTVVSREYNLTALDGMSMRATIVSRVVYETRRQARESGAAMPVGAPVTAVMQRLAQQYGWAADKLIVQPGAKLATSVQFDKSTDIFSFIHGTVCPALDTTGAAGNTGEAYVLFIEASGHVHFHQPNWGGNPRRNIVFGDLPEVVVRSPDGDVLDCRIETQLFKVAQMGLAEAVLRAYEAQRAQPVNAVTEATDLTSTNGDTKVAQLAYRVNIPIVASSEAERQAKITIYMEHLRKQAVKLYLTLRGRSDINLFDNFLLQYVLSSGKVHYLSGVYTAFAVSHSVGDSGWITHIEAYRLSLGDEDPAIKAAVTSVNQARVRAADSVARRTAKAERDEEVFTRLNVPNTTQRRYGR